MKFAVAVILYNPENSVMEQITIYQSLFNYVYLIDNSENVNDELLKYIHGNERFKYVSMNGNKGMSEALNEAFTMADRDNIDFLLTMDQDSKYSEVNICNMIKYIRENDDPSVAIYVANFAKIYWDKNYNQMIIGRYLLDKDEVKEVDMCLTSSSYTRVSAIIPLLPLKNYFIGYIDNFLSTELKENGYKLIRVGCSQFEQQVGSPVVYSKLNESLRILHHSPVRYYYMIRNNYYYQERFSYNKNCVKSSRIMRMRFLFNILIGEKNKINKLKACWLGFVDYKKRVIGEISEKYVFMIEGNKR